MEKYILTQSQRDNLLKSIGCNIIDNPTNFYSTLLEIANKSKWNIKDIQFLNQLIKDGMGYFLQSIFKDIFNHPLYNKYYGKKKYIKPMQMEEMHAISEKLKRNEITLEDVMNKYGGKISKIEELAETDPQRKDRLIEEKSEDNNNAANSMKIKTKLCGYKTK